MLSFIAGNLFESSATDLMSYSNYLIEVVSDKSWDAKHITNLSFQLIDRAATTPSTIILQLNDLYLVNTLKLEGLPMVTSETLGTQVEEQRPFSYHIKVARDFPEWVTSIDYSNLRCYSKQQLFFPKQAVRWVGNVNSYISPEVVFVLKVHSAGPNSGAWDAKNSASGLFLRWWCIHQVPVQEGWNPRLLHTQASTTNAVDCFFPLPAAPLVSIKPAHTQFVRSIEDGLRCFLKFNQPYSISLIRCACIL